VTGSLSLYRLGTRLLEPAVPMLVRRRLKAGKERAERISERFGQTKVARPEGALLWMHGASVGECRLLLDVFTAIKKKRPDLTALVTSQTLTSADMVSAWATRGVIHQMAPVDAPGAVSRFLSYWKPDGVVFAEGEIWPNMLAGIKQRGAHAALINARMTAKTLNSWKKRPAAAKEVFSTFGFIGAADMATAEGLTAATGRKIKTIGNLKIAAPVQAPPQSDVTAFRMAVDMRPIVLAASTHPGEDEFALDAFMQLRSSMPNAMLILVPRHPDRGTSIVGTARTRGFNVQQWSNTKSPPSARIDVLVADTIGELMFWYAVANAVYLGGATAEGIGGHNPIEPAQLGKRVFTGPFGFNFRETFDTLEKLGALQIGTEPRQLSDWWASEAGATTASPVLKSFFEATRTEFDATVAAILSMLDKRSR
jgi:3-deoxy-D-manno-octulosonic-acid transferase